MPFVEMGQIRENGQAETRPRLALVEALAPLYGLLTLGPRETGAVVVDADGGGIGLWKDLAAAKVNVVDFRGGRKPPGYEPGKTHMKRWETDKNCRTMAWFELAAGMRDRKVALIPDPVTKKQLTAVEYKFDASGLQQLQSKDDKDLRQRLDGGSPDRADALAMAYWGYVTRGAARRSVTDEKTRRKSRHWAQEFEEMHR